MPFFNDPNLEEDQNQGQGQPLVAGAGGVVTGAPGSQGASGAAAGPDAKQSRSGSWSNLVQYLDANKGNDAAVGEKIKSSVDSQANEANAAKQQFQTAANKAINDNQSAANRAVELSKQQPITAYKSGVSKDLAPSYNGPASSDQINEYAAAQQKAANVQNTAKLADQGHEGRVQLLDKSFGRPSYSQGEKNLDSFILGGGQGGVKALSDVSSTYGKYGDQFRSLADSVSGNLAKQKADADTARQTAQQNLQKQAQSYKDLLNAKAAEENARRKALDSNRFDFVESEATKAWDEIANEQIGNKVGGQNVNLSDYFWNNGKTLLNNGGEKYNAAEKYYGLGGDVTANNMATADEAQGYNNLMQYLGVQDLLSPQEAGAAQTFDKAAFQNQLRNEAKARLQERQSDAIAKIQGAKSGKYAITDKPTDNQYRTGSYMTKDMLRKAYSEAGLQLPDEYR